MNELSLRCIAVAVEKTGKRREELKAVSEIPFGELSVGDVVVSNMGTMGTITDLVAEGPISRFDDVYLQWDNGRISKTFHINCTFICHIGKSS